MSCKHSSGRYKNNPKQIKYIPSRNKSYGVWSNVGSVVTAGTFCSGSGVCQKLISFLLRQMVSLLIDFWGEIMELHDKIDPKNNINQILII